MKMAKKAERFVTKVATWTSLFCRYPSLLWMSRQFSFCMTFLDRPLLTFSRPRPNEANSWSARDLRAWVGIEREEWIPRESYRGLNGISLANVVARPCLDMQVIARFRQAVATRERG